MGIDLYLGSTKVAEMVKLKGKPSTPELEKFANTLCYYELVLVLRAWGHEVY